MTTSQPPKGAAGQVGNIRINPGDVELVQLHFTFFGGENEFLQAIKQPSIEDESEDPTLRFEYKFARVAQDAIVIALNVAIRAPDLATINATAKTRITVSVVEGADVDLDRELAEIASRMGPVIIYPYLREVVADVTRRAGLEPLTLPIYQIGNFFKVKPEELRFEEKQTAAKETTPARSKGDRKESKP